MTDDEGPVVMAPPPTPATPAAAAEAATPCVAWAAAAAAAATCLMLRQLQSGFVTPSVHRALDHMVVLVVLLVVLLLPATFRPSLCAGSAGLLAMVGLVASKVVLHLELQALVIHVRFKNPLYKPVTDVRLTKSGVADAFTKSSTKIKAYCLLLES